MRSPFDWITTEKQKPVFIVLVVLSLVVTAGLQMSGKMLVTEAAPGGILSYELAGSLPAARAMLESWGAAGKVAAGLNLGLDFLYLFIYAGSIGLGCVLVARKLAPPKHLVHKIGIGLAWGLPVAAFFDSLENYALIRLLLGSDSDTWPMMAYGCAVCKFALVLLGLVFVLVGGLVGLFRRQ